ncbi:hypothetical protein P691DRAFT_805047 [Macrolepiota fuliginosa MF-IS2]|uniref:Uncharacterized protein n=1 Tax=Macrolepiota fuliginosa MF-IS2 TaxID=1400762 RepID=A0A9P6C1U4_9AGAR|nr:hypothetical protein P691DRAFT_805047 [Macrolepiota fuliginosa MF-IS2]
MNYGSGGVPLISAASGTSSRQDHSKNFWPLAKNMSCTFGSTQKFSISIPLLEASPDLFDPKGHPQPRKNHCLTSTSSSTICRSAVQTAVISAYSSITTCFQPSHTSHILNHKRIFHITISCLHVLIQLIGKLASQYESSPFPIPLCWTACLRHWARSST